VNDRYRAVESLASGARVDPLVDGRFFRLRVLKHSAV